MKTGGDFHKDLAKDLRDPAFKALFKKEKARLNLSARLRNVINQSKLSIRKVALKMGTSKSQVERMIGDPTANIGIDALIRFAAVVGRRLEITIK